MTSPAFWIVPSALPFAAFMAATGRIARLAPRAPSDVRRARNLAWACALLGVVAGLAGALAERWLGRSTGLDPEGRVAPDWASMATLVLFFAPLAEALKVLAAWPASRSRDYRDSLDGVVCAAAVAMGFGLVESAAFLRTAPEGAVSIVRVSMAIPAHAFFAAVWGSFMGRARKDHVPPGREFFGAWVAATALRGVFDHLVFGRGAAALLAALPLLLAMGAFSLWAGREILDAAVPSAPSKRRTFLPSLPPPPSLRAMRTALRRAERPVMLGWIALGGLVTTGVMIACVVGAVVLARRMGVDFGVVDEGEVTSTVPLAILGSAVLVAFPVAGFLIARASAADSVLEPALSAGLAIVGTLVVLGLAAPVALVFALAFAPVAFGLACAGAWVGLGASH